MKKKLFAGFAILALTGALSARATLINSVGVDVSGNVTNITIDSVAIPVDDLVRVSGLAAVGFQGLLVNNGDSVPSAGSRYTVLTDDSILTGFGNLLTNVNSTILQFETAITNGPGADLVLFEMGGTGSGSDEQWRLTMKNGVTGYTLAVTNLVDGYTSPATTMDRDLLNNTPFITTLTLLEAATSTYSTSLVNADNLRFSVVPVDLSDLGYDVGDSLSLLGIAQTGNLNSTGLQNNGAAADLILAYGLYAIPEPASVGLVGMGLLGILGWRKRRAISMK